MVSSIARSTASGSTAVFSVPFPYLDKTHVQVRLNGVLKTLGVDYTFPTDSTIQITAGNPAAGTVVERRRVTPADPLTSFSPGNLDTGDLNVGILQPLYVAQEGSDSAADILLRAWFTASFGNGGTITVGPDGTILIWDASGNVVVGPSASDIQGFSDAAEAAQAAAEAAQAAAASSQSAAAGSASTASSAAAAAVAALSASGLPGTPVADTALLRNPGNTAYITQTKSQFKTWLATTAADVTFLQATSGGAVSTTAEAKLRGWVSLLDYGAVGDGDIANASVNATALANAVATGKKVWIPYTALGYHFGTNQVTCGNGTCIRGENGVLIKSTSTTSWLYLTANQGFPTTKVSGLTVDMTGSGASSTAIRIGTNTRICYGIRLFDLKFTNCVEAIGDETHVSNYVVDVQVTDVFCNFTRGRQVYFRRTRGFIRLRAVQVDHTFNAGSVTWNGVQFDDFAGIELNEVDVTGPVGDTTYHSTMYGIILNGTGGAAAAWLNRCNVDTGPGNGLLISNVSYVWLKDLDVNKNLGNQIVLSGVSKLEMVNIFTGGATGRTGAAAGGAGLSIISCTNPHGSNISAENCVGSGLTLQDTTDSLLSNVRSQSNGAKGIFESGTANKNIVNGANLSSNTTGNITLVGAQSVVLNAMLDGVLTGGQSPATQTNDNASAGRVGEYIEAVRAAGSALTLATGVNQNVQSISLTPGDWDVDGLVQFTGNTGTTTSSFTGSLSLVSATHDFTVGRGYALAGSAAAFNQVAAGVPIGIAIHPVRLSLASTTTVYLVGSAVFSVNTNTMYGMLRARRVR